MSRAEFQVRSDQWDIRINIAGDAHLQSLLDICRRYFASGAVRYVHVSNVERGSNSSHTSFGKEHVHIALVLHNYTSKSAVYKKFLIEETGWYIAARDKTRPIDGWILYHKKRESKLDPNADALLLELGSVPRVRRTVSDEQKEANRENIKRTKYEEWERRKYLVSMQNWDQLDIEFPGFIYSSSGQAMKRDILKQTNSHHVRPLKGELENYIIWGDSGTGKSSSVAYLYPNAYKKQKGSQFWDGYDVTNEYHKVVWIDEMSKETLMCLTGKADGGFEFLKELADRYPVTVDEKYTKGYKIRPRTVVITMNEHPVSLLPDRAVEVNKRALFRKFKVRTFENILSHSLYTWLTLIGRSIMWMSG